MADNLTPEAVVEALKPGFIEMSDRIWDMPELRYQEARSAEEQITMLEAHDFTVTRDLAGIPTAFMGESGGEGPVIALLGEFDALAGLSQQAGVAEKQPLEPGGNGHGCGHNLLGSAAMLAAVAARDWLARQGIKARIRYYGCPAEEGGSGKTFMVRAGVFDDIDAALTWHPGSLNGVMPSRSLANIQAYFRFHGRASHAAASPELGRSAFDALELMSIGVQYLREHMPSDARIHHSVTNTGGISPNVIPDFAEGLYLIRSPELAEVHKLFARVKKIAEGAALMTETTMQVEVDKACSNLLANRVLNELLQSEMERLQHAGFDSDDHDFAARIRETLSSDDVRAAYGMIGADAPADPPLLAETVIPLPAPDQLLPGSTDVGDVSWKAPLGQIFAATHALGTPMHSWQLVAQGKSPLAHRGMVFAAKAMAGAAAALARDPALLAKAKAEFAAKIAQTPYVCPIAPEVDLPFRRGK